MSCRGLAVTMTDTFSGVRLNSGKQFIASVARILVYSFTRCICSPLSTLRYSTISPSASIIVSLLFVRRSDCSFRSLCCFCIVFWYWYSRMQFWILCLTRLGSNGAQINSAILYLQSSSPRPGGISLQTARRGILSHLLFCRIIFASVNFCDLNVG